MAVAGQTFTVVKVWIFEPLAAVIEFGDKGRGGRRP
jgi:hypothetical protein